MKNNKGFTLIEILAAVTILAIISSISVIAVNRYTERTKNKAYETMLLSVCDAANNYVLNEGLAADVEEAGSAGITYDAVDLMRDKYLESLTDPDDKQRSCGANVNVKLVNDALDGDDGISEYSYFVKLRCKKYSSDTGFSQGCVINNRIADPGSPEPTIPSVDPAPTPDPDPMPDPDPTPDPDPVDPNPGSDTTSISCSVVKENNTWTNKVPVEIQVKCVSSGSSECKQELYTQQIFADGHSASIAISDKDGKTKSCMLNVYLDTVAPSKPIVNNTYDNVWTSNSYTVTLSSIDDASGIDYFAYRYPNSSVASEKEWHKYANSSRNPGDSTVFITTAFSKERNEVVEFRACDKAGNCSEISTSTIKIDKTPPTCTLSVTTDGVSFKAKSSDVVEYGLSTSATPTYNGMDLLSLSPDTFYGYVKDAAGNIGICSVSVIETNVSYYMGPPYPCIREGKPGTCTDKLAVYSCKDGYTQISDSYCYK